MPDRKTLEVIKIFFNNFEHHYFKIFALNSIMAMIYLSISTCFITNIDFLSKDPLRFSDIFIEDKNFAMFFLIASHTFFISSLFIKNIFDINSNNYLKIYETLRIVKNVKYIDVIIAHLLLIYYYFAISIVPYLIRIVFHYCYYFNFEAKKNIVINYSLAGLFIMSLFFLLTTIGSQPIANKEYYLSSIFVFLIPSLFTTVPPNYYILADILRIKGITVYFIEALIMFITFVVILTISSKPKKWYNRFINN